MRRVIRRVIGTLAASACTVAMLSGCTLFGGGGGDKLTTKLETGDCFDAIRQTEESGGNPELLDYRVKSCTDAHKFQATLVTQYPDADAKEYPGELVVSVYAEGVCLAAKSALNSTLNDTSSLSFNVIYPNSTSWTERNDRQIVCAVTSATGTLNKDLVNS